MRAVVESAAGAADAIQSEMETRLQVAEHARQAAQADEAENEKDQPKDALARRERRREADLKRAALALLADFVAKTGAAREEVVALRLELQEASTAVSTVNERLERSGTLMQDELAEATKAMEAKRASMAARLQTARQARQQVVVADDERRAQLAAREELLKQQAEAIAEQAVTEAEATIAKAAADADAARAEAELLRTELGKEAALTAPTSHAQMETRLQVAEQARRTARAVDAENRSLLKRREAELKAEAEAFAAEARADAKAVSTAAVSTASADVRWWVAESVLEEAASDVQALRQEMAQRMQRAAQRHQPAGSGEAARLEKLQARVAAVKAELLAIASRADAGLPPGVDEMSASILLPLLDASD